MSLSPNILAAFDQIGMLDELKAISYPGGPCTILYEDLTVITKLEQMDTAE